jgi:hypothetical protein
MSDMRKEKIKKKKKKKEVMKKMWSNTDLDTNRHLASRRRGSR